MATCCVELESYQRNQMGVVDVPLRNIYPTTTMEKIGMLK